MDNSNTKRTTAPLESHLGSCHCGAVRFQVDLEPVIAASRCNCTICTKTAATSAITNPAAFRLLAGEEALGSYEWGSKMGRRFFCKLCGIQCFGRGHLAELGGDYVSVNVNALDDIEPADVKLIYWDGRHDNWAAGPRDRPWPTFAKDSGAAGMAAGAAG